MLKTFGAVSALLTCLVSVNATASTNLTFNFYNKSGAERKVSCFLSNTKKSQPLFANAVIESPSFDWDPKLNPAGKVTTIHLSKVAIPTGAIPVQCTTGSGGATVIVHSPIISHSQCIISFSVEKESNNSGIMLKHGMVKCK